MTLSPSHTWPLYEFLSQHAGFCPKDSITVHETDALVSKSHMLYTTLQNKPSCPRLIALTVFEDMNFMAGSDRQDHKGGAHIDSTVFIRRGRGTGHLCLETGPCEYQEGDQLQAQGGRTLEKATLPTPQSWTFSLRSTISLVQSTQCAAFRYGSLNCLSKM